MLTLESSRAQFFELNDLPFECFWATLFTRVGADDVLSDPRFAEFLNWVPDHANCPELDMFMRDLAEQIPSGWPGVANHVFAGRVFESDADAEAWRLDDSGSVCINYGYTRALTAYATIFVGFLGGLADAMEVITSGLLTEDRRAAEEILTGINRRLLTEPLNAVEAIRGSFDKDAPIDALPVELRADASRRPDAVDQIVSSAEKWILAHELAHHLLGHLQDSFASAAPVRLIRDVASRSDLAALLSVLPDRQRQECEADLLGYLMVCGFLTSEELAADSFYLTTFGASLALISLGHTGGAWVESLDGVHPGVVLRLQALWRTVAALTSSIPPGRGGAHPLDQIAQVNAFVSLCLWHWRERTENAGAEFDRLYDVLADLLDAKIALKQRQDSSETLS